MPGDEFTEAGAGADYLHTRGIPDDAILRETTSRNSWESLRGVGAVPQGTAAITRVVLVSDPFHSLRIRLIADEIGFDAVTSPTRTSPIHGSRRVASVLRRGAARRGRPHLRLRTTRPGDTARGVGEDWWDRGPIDYPDADLRGWCNRQHNRFWPCHWGFESSPPSSPAHRTRWTGTRPRRLVA